MNAMTTVTTTTTMTMPSHHAPALRAGRELCFILSLTLLIALSAQVRMYLPGTPVPVTLQSLAVILVGLWGGGGRGSAAAALYVALGTAGLPFFADLSGGVAALLGPTGGYIVGFLVVPALVAALSRDSAGRRRGWPALVAIGVLAHAAIFAFGLPWLKIVGQLDWSMTIAVGLLPFLVGTVIKSIIAAGFAGR